MFTIAQLRDFLAALISYTFYANEFSPDSASDSAMVVLTPGFAPSKWTPYRQPSVQIIVRGSKANGAAAEAKANELYDKLHQLSEFHVGSTLVRQCTADQSAPMFIGRDESERPMYSINFTLTLL